MRTFAKRNLLEILRDPLTAAFSLGFPLVLLALFHTIQRNIPVPMFELPHVTPGLAVFGLSFMTLFSATLIARDRETALLSRLYTTPLQAADFILGYMLPVLPLALGQCAVCFLAAALLELPLTGNLLWCVLFIVPVSLPYIALGLLCGSVMNVRQVGGVCGALLTNLAAWLSGVWFDVSLVGGAFQKLANMLPFLHAVELERALLRGDWGSVLPRLGVVLCYGAALTGLAVWLFLRQMKRQ